MSAARPTMPLRDAAVAVAQVLLRAGFEAYFAGGCVRDRLLGGVPDDYDIATAARPEEVRRLFPRAHGVGECFGVMLVRHGGHEFEIATFRNDGHYADGRRPSEVRFADAREDAFRRDFTVNGLFEEPLTGEIVDFVGGRRDLESRLVRAIGDPEARFAEDHLRLLRGVRFAARFGFVIEEGTAAAMRRHAPKLALIARERIGGEIRRMLEHPTRVDAVRILEGLGLDEATLRDGIVSGGGSRPRLAGLAEAADGDLEALGLSDRTVPVAAALAAWLLDRRDGDRRDGDRRAGNGQGGDRQGGDPPGGSPSAGGEPADSAVAAWRDALLLSNREVADLQATLAGVDRLREWGTLGEAGRKRWAAAPMASWAQAIVAAVDRERAESVISWRRTTDPSSIAPTPLVTGDDLIRAGFTPGPRFRPWLDQVYDAQLEGRVRTAPDALAFAVELAKRG